MKCFYHPTKDAVGTCKHCSRGLCSHCAAEREGGLACRDKHEAIVDAVSSLINRNVRVTNRAASTTTLSTTALSLLVFWGGAIVFFYLLLGADYLTERLLFGVMAAVMFVCGIPQIRLLLSLLSKKSG